MSVSIEIGTWSVLPKQASDGSLVLWVKLDDGEYVHVITVRPDGKTVNDIPEEEQA